MALEASYHPDYLYDIVHEKEGNPLYLIDKVGLEEDNEKDILDRIVLQELLSQLKERDRQVIFLRYFKDKTQMEVADILGISQVQVSRIEKRIIREMKKKLAKA